MHQSSTGMHARGYKLLIMNCELLIRCFAIQPRASLVGMHPFAPTRCLVGGKLVHSLQSSRRCSRRTSLPPSVRGFTLLVSRATLPTVQLSSSPCPFLHSICAKSHYLMVVASHHLGRLLTSGAIHCSPTCCPVLPKHRL